MPDQEPRFGLPPHLTGPAASPGGGAGQATGSAIGPAAQGHLPPGSHPSDPPTRVIIMGAAGRDFHNFNVVFRGNPRYQVVAFTATQIPDIADRRYPPLLAGPGYPEGIPIYPEEDLPRLAQASGAHWAVFAYSDISHTQVMHQASRCLALGLDFWLLGPASTMLPSPKPVVAVTAVRTGVGKSQTTRRLAELLLSRGSRVVVVRHPMPYGDLARQVVQRFVTYEDLDRHDTTIEEREEYEPHLRNGVVVYAGVDYAAVLAEASREADVILWDGGNNDLPFYRPHLHLVLVDPHRPGHETAYHPGEANLRLAHVAVINKVDTARPEGVEAVREAVRRCNPGAMIIEAASPIFVDDYRAIRGRRVLVIEDGPTLTHGGMKYGAGVIAARKFGAAELVDPRPYAVGSMADAFGRYDVGPLLPAMGYGRPQMADLEATIGRTPADLVLIATPIDLRRLIGIRQPVVRVSYELAEIGRPNLEDALDLYLGRPTPARSDREWIRGQDRPGYTETWSPAQAEPQGGPMRPARISPEAPAAPEMTSGRPAPASSAMEAGSGDLPHAAEGKPLYGDSDLRGGGGAGGGEEPLYGGAASPGDEDTSQGRPYPSDLNPSRP